MRIIDFKNLTMKTETEYKKVQFTFQMADKLEWGLFPFTNWLSATMKTQINAANLSQYKDDNIVFEFKTDLRNMDLDPMIPPLLTAFVLNLNIDKTVFKHGEKILGVPRQLSIDKGLLMDANALDLINYNLPVEKFNIVFFNVKDKAIISVIA
jgi:hypothetical protein